MSDSAREAITGLEPVQAHQKLWHERQQEGPSALSAFPSRNPAATEEKAYVSDPVSSPLILT